MELAAKSFKEPFCRYLKSDSNEIRQHKTIGTSGLIEIPGKINNGRDERNTTARIAVNLSKLNFPIW